MENNLAIQITDLKKRYRLGVIGGGTLQGDIQSWWAKVRGKEDPNSKIGAKVYKNNETFMALNGITFSVKEGDRVGIIGHNGAGKSTLLKLLSRVTAPTEGEIKLNGRISSMLEVGTGFNGELTGRENIYMNGAILGMTKKEVDAKMDKIIEFSECAKFIDTPVKRYSSGMYVKLAFSVAAHLDSEILIMDEVLAVGDMAFQTKCLNKMNEVSKSDGKTILYVSHNMATIRNLCNRCIVLDHGKLIFDGDVEKAIELYLGANKEENSTVVNLEKRPREGEYASKFLLMTKLELLSHPNNIINSGDTLRFAVTWKAKKDLPGLRIHPVLSHSGIPVASFFTDAFCDAKEGENHRTEFEINTDALAKGNYNFSLGICQFFPSRDYPVYVDELHSLMPLTLMQNENEPKTFLWCHEKWGSVKILTPNNLKDEIINS